MVGIWDSYEIVLESKVLNFPVSWFRLWSFFVLLMAEIKPHNDYNTIRYLFAMCKQLGINKWSDY